MTTTNDSNLENIKALLIDIEGTTTPITFVTEVLFPYVKTHLKEYLTENWEKDEVQDDISSLRSQYIEDCTLEVEDAPEILQNKEKSKESVIESVVKNVEWQMSLDRKITALKQLQGHMWRSAYEDGKIKGEVYEDVPPALRILRDHGKELYIYSSGSVEAQKLLFKYSNHGNMCELFEGHFDTKIGSKKESESYGNIANSIGLKPKEILFLTDVVVEAEAAESADVKVCILVRPGNKKLTEEEKNRFKCINSFETLVPEYEIPTKIQKLEKNGDK